ncbi:predicted protein [Chaetoceros tenuissimus]|uniref:Uncharacterized protein n=1 Tax=Chaetoceros tenuissimus TaxID=426638 RepID=A0AAD3CKY0_9STRA|nr:predicted protein [Chaetoceros tenuissimus]
MGKKSKRRNGKQKQKQKKVFVNSENAAPESNCEEQTINESVIESFPDDKVPSQNSSTSSKERRNKDIFEEADANIPKETQENYEYFFRYERMHGEEAARKIWKDWSPPEGTPDPHDIFNLDFPAEDDSFYNFDP